MNPEGQWQYRAVKFVMFAFQHEHLTTITFSSAEQPNPVQCVQLLDRRFDCTSAPRVDLGPSPDGGDSPRERTKRLLSTMSSVSEVGRQDWGCWRR